MTKGRISRPNYTQIPNVIFDYWMPILTPGEFKVLLCIARQTFGWHKERARISLKQLVEKTGLTKKPITQMIEKLISHGIVKKLKFKDKYDGSDAPNQYEINIFDKEKEEGGEGDETPGRGVLKTQTPVSSEHTTSSPPHIDIERKVDKETPKGVGAFLPSSSSYQKGKFVKLPLEEYDKLCHEHGETTVSQIIDEMNDYVEATGKKYKSYAAAIRNWVRRRKEKQKEGKWKDPKHNRSQKNPDGTDTPNDFAGIF